MPSNLLELVAPQSAPGCPRAVAKDAPAASRNPSVLLFIILTAQLMVVLDTTIVNVALPISSGDWAFPLPAFLGTQRLHPDLRWIAAPRRPGRRPARPAPRLSDRHCPVHPELACGGLASTGWMLLAARAVQGMGAALAAPTALSLLTARSPRGRPGFGPLACTRPCGRRAGRPGSSRWAPHRARLVALGHVRERPHRARGLVLGRVVIGRVRKASGPLRFVIGGRDVDARDDRDRLRPRRGRDERVGASAVAFARSLGGSLLGLFVHHESRVDEPILPLRLLAHATRSAANIARGLLYAGMYGMFFFLVAVLPGRSAVLSADRWRGLPAHARLGIPVVPADRARARCDGCRRRP